MIKEKKYDFHFIMDKRMKTQLLKLDIFEGVKSLSGIIMNILQVLLPVFEEEKKWGRQKQSKYLLVCDDLNEVRENVHVYVPDVFYRKLKSLHDDLNIFSIAQLVRGFLEFFLNMVAKYGRDVFQELNKMFARWRKQDAVSRQTCTGLVRQLLQIFKSLPGKTKLFRIYDEHYSPIWTLTS